MGDSLDAIERARWAASPLYGDAAVEEHAAVRVAEAEPAEGPVPPSVRTTLSLDGTWLLAGTLPGREFSIERWSGADTARRMPVDWYREDTDRSAWVPARVPGTVQGALTEAGVIPDPLLHDNTYAELMEHGVPAQFPWHFRRTRVEQQEWWYARRFTVPAEWSGQRVRLSFDGLDYSGAVYLNGEPVARHSGMYGGPDVVVSTLLRFGAQNELVVRLDPPPWDWHGVLKPSPGWGWHYGHLISIGIWRSVRLELVPDLELTDPFVVTDTISGDHAQVAVQWDAVRHDFDEGAVDAQLTIHAPDGTVVAERTVAIRTAPGVTRHRVGLSVDRPSLWWPFGYGEQPLYRATVSVAGSSVSTEFGIRTVETRPLPERSGPEFYDWQFVINGRSLFLKGANWCWTDPMARRGFETDRHVLDLVVRANLQMLRAWGGGTIESDEFYRECDRRGILVYQEFPLNFGLDSTIADLGTLDEQVSRVVRRLRNHPSLVMWGGGNENPATVTSDDLLTLVGRRVGQYDPSRPFHRTDPWGGSEHYYGVYHEGRPVSTYTELQPAVFGEYGLSSQPDLASMRRFLDPDLLEHWPPPAHGSILQHQSQFSLFDLFKQARYADYGPLRDWRTFIEYSQLAQGDALRFASEQTRARSGASAAAYWFYKVGEVFPGASWAVVDYYGAPKLSYYRAKQFSAPISAFAVTDRTEWGTGEQFSAAVHVANDTPDAVRATVTVRLYDAGLRQIASLTREVEVTPDTRVETDGLLAVIEHPSALLLSVYLTDPSGGRLSSAWYAFNAHPKSDAKLALENEPIDSLRDHPIERLLGPYAEQGPAPLLDLPRTTLTARIDGMELVITNTGEHPAPTVIIDGFPYELGRWLDDNAFGLLAGEVRRVPFEAGGADLSGLSVRAWNADPVAAVA